MQRLADSDPGKRLPVLLDMVLAGPQLDDRGNLGKV